MSLEGILPKLISPQQSGFMKGRQISDNILLALEMCSALGKKVRGSNVALKLDMAKASSRGLRQGDPLSPALFIIAAEVLSRGLNTLVGDLQFSPYFVTRGCPPLTHLAYADDIIIFCNGSKRSLACVMEVLGKYQRISGQLVNVSKSCFLVDKKRLGSWRGRWLSMSARAILIKHALSSISIHILAVLLWWLFGCGLSLWAQFMRARGDVAFWWDNWSGLDPLAWRFPDLASNARVYDFLHEGQWDHLALAAFPLEVTESAADSFFCFGKKFSFLMWRLLHEQLPVDDVLAKFQVHGPSRCQCCLLPQLETLQHVFATGVLATEVWGFFGQLLGVATPSVACVRSRCYK
nr:uncharacterized protein LOC113705941 [Coffea arabica]